MSKLIQMRNRIQTIETIRKVTDAMRIISMSAHSRLKAKQDALDNYLHTLSILLAKVQQATPSWSNERLMPTSIHNNNPLIILIGSQKGLCGGFNSHLLKFFDGYLKEYPSAHYHFVAVGKKAVDYMQAHHSDAILKTYPTLTAQKFLIIAQQL